jgi:cell division protein ZipA
MDELRWVLLGVGSILIAGIYLWGMRGSLVDRLRKPDHGLDQEPDLTLESESADPLDRLEPDLGQAQDLAEGDGDASSEVSVSAPGPVDALDEETERLNLVLTIIAPEDGQILGLEMASVASELGLRKGRSGTLDCYPDESGGGRPVFSIANVLEPGTFDWSRLETTRTPGLVCFMRLPGPTDPQSSLELMLNVAGVIADRLGGRLCDDRRNRLSQQGIEHLRGEVAEFERRRRLEALRRTRA